MIHCIGLPRCAGQTLAAAINILYPERKVYHSIEGHRWCVVDDTVAATVEVYVPYRWLERHWPGSMFIANHRESKAWYESCLKVYGKSQKNRWNHPLWQYPPDSWLDYYNEYWARVERMFPQDRVLWWDITTDPSWYSLCDFLDLPVPSQPFPNKDHHGRVVHPTIDWPSPWNDAGLH